MASCSEASDDFEIVEADDSELREYANLIQRSLPSTQRVLAVCGPWSGRTRFFDADGDRWIADGVSEGRLAFISDGDGIVDVSYRDALGSTLTVVEDGGEIDQVAFNGERGFTIQVGYGSTGNSEVYALSEMSDGSTKLMWATVKQMGLSKRVSAFESDCIDG